MVWVATLSYGVICPGYNPVLSRNPIENQHSISSSQRCCIYLSGNSVPCESLPLYLYILCSHASRVKVRLANYHSLRALQHGFFCLHSPSVLYQQ